MSNSLQEPIIISADSHVIEDPNLWVDRLPDRFKSAAPVFPPRAVGQQFQGHPGGYDPIARVEEMAIDGVSAEVLYPSLTMNLFGLSDAAMQQACFRVYNDWIIEYCAAAPAKVFGIGMISTYDMDHAVAELERCRKMGLVGAMVWEVPPTELSFATDHYDRLWDAAQSLKMPISVHSLTGTPYQWPHVGPAFDTDPVVGCRRGNRIIYETADLISDIIGSGTLERFPGLRFVIVESEASWIPVFLSRHDKYYSRSKDTGIMTMPPSEYFDRQFSVTFFNDQMLAGVFQLWGTHNCMWSSDFPHPNSPWPNSRKVIERDLGHLPADARARLTFDNVIQLYDLPLTN